MKFFQSAKKEAETNIPTPVKNNHPVIQEMFERFPFNHLQTNLGDINSRRIIVHLEDQMSVELLLFQSEPHSLERIMVAGERLDFSETRQLFNYVFRNDPAFTPELFSDDSDVRYGISQLTIVVWSAVTELVQELTKKFFQTFSNELMVRRVFSTKYGPNTKEYLEAYVSFIDYPDLGVMEISFTYDSTLNREIVDNSRFWQRLFQEIAEYDSESFKPVLLPADSRHINDSLLNKAVSNSFFNFLKKQHEGSSLYLGQKKLLKEIQ